MHDSVTMKIDTTLTVSYQYYLHSTGISKQNRHTFGMFNDQCHFEVEIQTQEGGLIGLVPYASNAT